MAQLICEGACNPTIESVDALGELLIDGTEGTGKGPRGLPKLWEQQRQLRYTEHEGSGVWWQCTVCRHARRWGKVSG